jgi:hypothetical protein
MDEGMWPELQTMRMTYQQISMGERPWNALGDFLNYWFGYATDRRGELVQDPIREPEDAAQTFISGPPFVLPPWNTCVSAPVSPARTG